jgi:hypothetical protein
MQTKRNRFVTQARKERYAKTENRLHYQEERPAGLWGRLSYKDELGKQRVIQRKVENRTEGGKLIKGLMRGIE